MERHIVIFIEHPSRELPIVMILARYLWETYHIDTTILPVYLYAHRLLALAPPHMILLPFAISENASWPLRLCTDLYGDSVPIMNLSWEQYLFPIMQQYKIPRDTPSRQCYVPAWHSTHVSFLRSHGVTDDRIRLLGDPKHDLLLSKQLISKKHQALIQEVLKTHKAEKVIFCPMNFAWAFYTDAMVRSRVTQGFPKENAYQYRQTHCNFLSAFLDMIIDISKQRSHWLFIIRPHPGVSDKHYVQRFIDRIGRVPDNIIIRSDATAHDWAFCADVVCSSWSTVCLDSRIMGIPSFYYHPHEVPAFIKSEWMASVPSITTINDADAFISHPPQPPPQTPINTTSYCHRLADWINTLTYDTHPKTSGIFSLRWRTFYILCRYRIRATLARLGLRNTWLKSHDIKPIVYSNIHSSRKKCS